MLKIAHGLTQGAASRRPSRLLLTWSVGLALVLAGLVTAALATATALAAMSALDAKSLALRAQDVPPSAKRMSQKENRTARLPGGTGQAFTTTFQFLQGRRVQAVGAIVFTAPTASVARRTYDAAVREAKREAAAPLLLSPLGDEQYAALYGRPQLDEASAVVWVRRNTVVWQIQVSSVKNPFGFSRAEARAELTRYAVKQKRRVGAG